MFEYRVIPSPLRTKKIKSAKGTESRFAGTLELELNRLAADGWEYMRAETLPCEERSAFGKVKSDFQSVLIFRRRLSVDGLASVRQETRSQPDFAMPPLGKSEEPGEPTVVPLSPGSTGQSVAQPPLTQKPVPQPVAPPGPTDRHDPPPSDDFPAPAAEDDKQRE